MFSKNPFNTKAEDKVLIDYAVNPDITKEDVSKAISSKGKKFLAKIGMGYAVGAALFITVNVLCKDDEPYEDEPKEFEEL